jgi:UDP-glucose:(heptosyl)LPS alpha-1,3-glucosyltransferase
MNIAFCYPSVLPARGGCETYITDLARRLIADGHPLHLYACYWDAAALPEGVQVHPLPPPRGPRFVRPWRFATACHRAVRAGRHDVSLGFDKTWGQDILYPQGGLHAASVEHNLRKYRQPLLRRLARGLKWFDPAHWSFSALERKQYLGDSRPLVIVNSNMVRRHFLQHYGITAESLRVVHSAIDPARFEEHDRPRRRLEWREQWRITPEETVGLFVAMNYQLKGLEPLLHAVRRMPTDRPFRLLVVGNPDTTRYQQLARRLGIAARVCFAGHCAESRYCYFAADFLVHPTFYDPCSLVVLEAMTCGLPVLTSRYNGASELLHPPEEGFVVDDPHDDDRLAWHMTQFLEPRIRAVCGHAARRTAAQWTFEHHYRQLLRIFSEVAARKRAA